jgi:hypothetical protein
MSFLETKNQSGITTIDLKEKFKSINNWQLFIDHKEKRLCFVIWCVNEELYA